MSKQWEFLESVFLSNAVRDSITTRKGRRVYKNDKPTDAERAELGNVLKAELRALAQQYYSVDVDDESHIKNIRGLADRVTASCAHLLNGGRLPFGIAQKALNVYLKYLWCADPKVRPPHCPFDNDVLTQLKLPVGCQRKWTECDSEDTYRTWVSAARSVATAKGQSLAEWEIEAWATAQTRKSSKPTSVLAKAE